ncbi:hypothetical protein MIR68_011803 [Amoeboaphelidium protococcarum]|nr:hypothetical protein MIR68_011803 [Amoeboaphelidium protococcarum]
MDFSTAFLNGHLEEDIYMHGPSGTELEGKIVKLQRSLYGLKQAPRCWNTAVDSLLKELGFERSRADNCLYFRRYKGWLSLIVLYVDDILLIAKESNDVKRLQQELQRKFDMKDPGVAEFIVGMKVECNWEKKTIALSQPAYIDKILSRFNLSNCNPALTPFAKPIAAKSDIANSIPKSQYRTLIGSVMYLMVATRPDISFAVSQLSSCLEHRFDVALQQAKRLLRYLKVTRDFKLTFDGNTDWKPLAYADADFASDLTTARSITGLIVKVCNEAVTWKSNLQIKIAQSTADAEYYSVYQACQVLVWMKEMLIEIGMFETDQNCGAVSMNKLMLKQVKSHPKDALFVMEDNQACIALSKNPEKFQRTKHIEVKYHFVRELVADGVVKLQYCLTETADALTKALSRDAQAKHRAGMGLLREY